jgi:GNAT superfamily N-acetyltransferase
MTAPASPRAQLRARIQHLLNESAPMDALASFYALHSPPERSEVFLYPRAEERAAGFLVRARTGMDLFRPLVTFRAETEAAAQALFTEGIPASRPVYLTVPERLAEWANKHLSVTEAELHRLYRLRADRLKTILNVLTVTSYDPSGGPRCEIRAGNSVGAVAGVNWQSPDFAEIYVYTDPPARGRGWGKAVVSTLCGLILKSGRTPLYVVGESNDYSIRVAEAVGFDDTGWREYVGQAVRVE